MSSLSESVATCIGTQVTVQRSAGCLNQVVQLDRGGGVVARGIGLEGEGAHAAPAPRRREPVEGGHVARKHPFASKNVVDDAVAESVGHRVGQHRREAVEGLGVQCREGEGADALAQRQWSQGRARHPSVATRVRIRTQWRAHPAQRAPDRFTPREHAENRRRVRTSWSPPGYAPRLPLPSRFTGELDGADRRLGFESAEPVVAVERAEVLLTRVARVDPLPRLQGAKRRDVDVGHRRHPRLG